MARSKRAFDTRVGLVGMESERCALQCGEWDAEESGERGGVREACEGKVS